MGFLDTHRTLAASLSTATMQHRSTIECVDELLRKITSIIDKPFGGKKLLAVGDFRQIAPVVSGASKSDTIAAPIRFSHLWPAFASFVFMLLSAMLKIYNTHICRCYRRW